MTAPSDKAQMILDYITEYHANSGGMCPNYATIAEKFGMSTSTASIYVKELNRKGYVGLSSISSSIFLYNRKLPNE